MQLTNEEEFLKELTQLINKHSLENGSNTPDFILANYLSQCLIAFDYAVGWRTNWYGRRQEKTYNPISKSNDEKDLILQKAILLFDKVQGTLQDGASVYEGVEAFKQAMIKFIEYLREVRRDKTNE